MIPSRERLQNKHRTVSIRLRFASALILPLAMLAAGVCFAEDPNLPSIHSNHGAWPLARQWTPAETQHFAQWIEHIYQVKKHGTSAQRLAKLERVLTDPEMNLLLDPEFAGEDANPQLDTETIWAMHTVLDCAKLTVALTTYYAYRRGLPWMVTHVRPANGGDLRTTDYNIPAGCASSFEYGSAHEFFVDAIRGLCTGNFRVEPNRRNSEISDTAPVAIQREYLIPGCLFYLDGHVLVLAHIDKYGEPHFLDSTTAVTRDIFSHNGLNAVTGIVAPAASKTSDSSHDFTGCYRGFRVQRFPIAEVDESGNVSRVRRRTDEEMAEFGYSTEQYQKLRELTDQGRIVDGGVLVDNFHEFIRLRLRTAERVTPIDDIRTWANDMAALLQAREERVQEGWRDVCENGPVPFPEDHTFENVFTAGGRWGRYSTAALDANLREEYFDLLNVLDHAASWLRVAPDDVDLPGINRCGIWAPGDLASVLIQQKQRIFAETAFQYANSDGQPVTLSLLDIEQRLYDLSFDPNQPPELRWGAAPDSPEAQAAPERGTPLPGGHVVPMIEAYQRQAYYRSLPQRESEPSYLRKMFTEGFPIRKKIDDDFAQKWQHPSPPLVPHNGLAAWVKEQAAASS